MRQPKAATIRFRGTIVVSKETSVVSELVVLFISISIHGDGD